MFISCLPKIHPIENTDHMQSEFIQKINKKIEIWTLSPRYSVLRHLLFICILASQFHVFNPGVVQYFVKHAGISSTVAYLFLLSKAVMAIFLSYVVLVYLNPQFLYKGKYAYYLFGLILFFLSFWLAYLGLFELFVPNYLQQSQLGEDVDFTTPAVLLEPLTFLGAATGFRFFKKLLSEKEKYAELEKEKLSAELVQLKNQVNPHFLFNTLNNLHVLIKTNPEHAAQIVLGLSDVLRYQTYDSASEKVLLTKDIAVISNYIAIEKLRRDTFVFRIHTLGELSNVMIPPLIFIVFVENALKHSLAVRQSTYVELFFSLENEMLQFVIKNSKPQKQMHIEQGGVGLFNVKKRLGLLYGENYQLLIDDKVDAFEVTLKIPL